MSLRPDKLASMLRSLYVVNLLVQTHQMPYTTVTSQFNCKLMLPSAAAKKS